MVKRGAWVVGGGALLLAVVVIGARVDTAALGQAVDTALRSPVRLGVVLAAFGGAFVLRALLWSRVLRTLPVGDSLAAVHMGLAANHLLPLRMGEAVRPLVAARRTGISAGAAGASTLVLRVLDMAALLGLGWIAAPAVFGMRLGWAVWLAPAGLGLAYAAAVAAHTALGYPAGAGLAAAVLAHGVTTLYSLGGGAVALALPRLSSVQHRRIAAIVVAVTLLGVPPVVSAAPDSPPASPAGPSLPEGFEDTLVAGATAPTTLAWTPAGQMLLGTQQGRLYLGTDGKFPETPVLDLSDRLCPRLEQGLLGTAAHPDFGTNGWVYVFWTHDVAGCVHRVSRFTVGPSGVADPASEMVIVDNIPSPNGNHNGGDLQFGPDDYLYVSIGDGGCDYDGGPADCAGANDSSRDRHVLQGKILRIGAAGEIPPDNPFLGEYSARCHETGMTKRGRTCQETFAWGLRNPFRIAFDPDSTTTRFFINDVGQNVWEEIDEGIKGADYGWNVREGHCANASRTDCGPPPQGMTDPIHSYPHEDGCGAITGGAFVPEAAGWPDELVGDYLFADYACGTIFRLERHGKGGWASSPFITGLGDDSAVHLTFGPSPFGLSLYYTTYGSGGQVRRFDYLGKGERPPRADLVADPAFGDTPLRATLDAGGSQAYGEAHLVRYHFDPGDGSGIVEQDSPRLEHTYQQTGTVTASVTAVDSRGETSPPATVTVRVGETPPAITVETPAGPFAIGDAVMLSARGTDATDGPVPPEKLTWHVVLHHDAHTHPFLGPVTGAELRFDYPRPESLRAAANSYLEVRVTATDSAGLTGRAVVDLRPRLVELSFDTEPEGLAVTVDEEAEVTPWTVQAWVGLPVRIAASEQTRDGQRYRFDEWSDDGDEDHLVTAPEAAVTFTARFKRR